MVTGVITGDAVIWDDEAPERVPPPVAALTMDTIAEVTVPMNFGPCELGLTSTYRMAM